MTHDKLNKRPKGVDGHLSIKDSSLTSCQKGSYLHISCPIIEKNKNQQWHRKAALYSLNTIAINVMYIDIHVYRGHEFYKFGRPFLSHHNYALSLSKSCPRVEEKILKQIMQFNNITYMARPQQSTPTHGVMKFTILVDNSLVI